MTRSPSPETPGGKACARCGTPYGLALQSDRGEDRFFCQACWTRVLVARRLRAVALAFAAVTLAGGAALTWATGSSAPALVALFVSLAVTLAAFGYGRRPGARG
jgi:hypothetical protein